MRIISLIISLLLTTNATLAEWDSGSSWNLVVKYAIDEEWFLASRNNVATRDGLGDTFIQYYDLNIGYNVTDNWAAEVGYRHFLFRLPGRWRQEYRPLINVTWMDIFDGWRVMNRHRFEFRFFEGNGVDDRTRYRNETRIIAPFEIIPGTGIKPFIEEEFFLEFTDDNLNMNWLTVGPRARLADGIFLKLGYRWQAQKLQGEWIHRNVAVLGLNLFL